MGTGTAPIIAAVIGLFIVFAIYGTNINTIDPIINLINMRKDTNSAVY